MDKPKAKENKVEWEERRYKGTVICYVDRADPTHIKVWTKVYGEKSWIEIWTSKQAA